MRRPRAPWPRKWPTGSKRWWPRISRRTGRLIATKVVLNHRRAAAELASFAQAWPQPLTYAGIDARFNEAFRNHLLGALRRGPGTYNHYLGLLRAFLLWAVLEGHPVNPRFKEVLQPVEHHTFVESFTEGEVLAIAAIDFESPAVRAYVQAHFPEQPTAGIKRMLTLPSTCAACSSRATSCCSAPTRPCASATPTGSRPGSCTATWPA
jgi:hypothetical protein